MFSGIVQNRAPVTIEARLSQLWTLSVPLNAKQGEGLSIGASIALNGACLTVTRLEQGRAYFDVMMETLRVTNLADLSDGELVNVERAARFGDDIGGHVMSGHVHHCLPVVDIERPENNCIIWFGITAEQRRYLFPKGYVGLNGCSLTIGEVRDDRFNVFLIPETLAVTTFGEAQVGDRVNVEFDAHTQAIVDTLARMKVAGQL
ncbi:riboflavin synthase subunit alpha [Saccharospirillum sp.]|uniref:riboflavin synthase subunit alpha n=1 Tax=Saccharospirillum sp. TaxID=2033801 RepID=UPI0034A04702